ncbi:MAG: hypothetical protein FJ206_14340 [Gemmatimonadetes bacterium]|nr:hypothetical protein [Gemmatimonadota bacterium]
MNARLSTWCAVALIAGCGRGFDSAAEPTEPNFAATVETLFKGRFPIGPRSTFNDCTNEWVDIVGEYNLVVRQVTSANGGVHFMIHSVAGHVTGVGQTSGTRYASNEHTNLVQHSGGPVSILVLEIGITTVTKGKAANNAPGKLQIFMVVNANGELVVDRVEVRFDC